MTAQRQTWIDALRLTAGVSMVGLHATSDAAGQPFPDAEFTDRLAPLLLRALIYTARTELFLIISIFLLLMALDTRPRGYLASISQQARRLLLPFAFWTVFYAFYSLHKAWHFGYDAWLWQQLQSPWVWVEYVILGTSKYHMHFIPTLFGLLLFFPLFRLAAKWPILGLMVLLGLVIKRWADGYLWGHFYDHEMLSFWLRGVKILTYCGYGMAAGALYGLWQRNIFGKSWWPVLMISGGGLFAIKLYATVLTAQTGSWPFHFTPGFWADFLMPLVLFGAAFMTRAETWPLWFSAVAKYSFGIYLCHPIFLDLVEIATRQWTVAPIVLVGVKITVGVFCTLFFVRLLEKMRALAWTIGLGPLPRPIRFGAVRKGQTA